MAILFLDYFFYLLTGKPPPESKKQRAPAFTFGQKLDGAGSKAGPGPASYNTEGMTAKGQLILSNSEILCMIYIFVGEQ